MSNTLPTPYTSYSECCKSCSQAGPIRADAMSTPDCLMQRIPKRQNYQLINQTLQYRLPCVCMCAAAANSIKQNNFHMR